MKAIPLSSVLLFLGVSSMAAGGEAARTFVQATILGSNPARATLTFLDASGRQRIERATGEAVPSLAVVRPGDQAILSLSTEAGGTVVTRVRVHRAAGRGRAGDNSSWFHAGPAELAQPVCEGQSRRQRPHRPLASLARFSARVSSRASRARRGSCG